jgi:hypothetical protein
MTSKFDMKTFLAKREFLKKRFEAERTGEQTLFTNQEKLFKPLIESQKETSKAIENKISANQDILSNTLVPFTRELQKRNDQMDTLQNLPFYNIQPGIEDVPQSTPKKDRDIINIDLDQGLKDETHRENLSLLGLDLPSEVQKQGTIEVTLQKIKSTNMRLGQLTGSRSTKSEGEKVMLESQKETMKIYKKLIKGLEGAQKFISKSGDGISTHKLCTLKRGRGRPKKYPDTIFYKDPHELCEILFELNTAKEAGNTGLDNTINSVLDELLNIKSITKDEYDKLYKNIFS